MDSKLTASLWKIVPRDFGGSEGHSCDLMALDSNAMMDNFGATLPHFTPYPTPGSSGVNIFAQDLSSLGLLMGRPYVFPPSILVGPVLRFLQAFKQSCTLLVMDVYPKKFWWPLIMARAQFSKKLASAGDSHALLVPSSNGWVPHGGIPGDLWAFYVVF